MADAPVVVLLVFSVEGVVATGWATGWSGSAAAEAEADDSDSRSALADAVCFAALAWVL